MVPVLKSNKEIRNLVLLGTGAIALSRISYGFCHFFQKLDESSGKAFGVAYSYAEKTAYIVAKIALCSFYFWTTSRFFHELGHAIFAGALFQNSFPRIEMTMTSQKTVYFPQSLTPLGQKLGWKNSLLLYAGGGYLFDLVHDFALLTFGHMSEDNEVKTETHLLVGMNTLKNGIYAMSALWSQTKKVSHDFIQLQKFGKIDPLVAAIAIFAIPVIYKIFLKIMDDFKTALRKFGYSGVPTADGFMMPSTSLSGLHSPHMSQIATSFP